MTNLKCPDILLDSLENGQLVIDDKFIVHYWNKWLSVNTQILKKDILNKSLQEFYPDINYKVLLRKIKTAIQLNAPTFYDSNNRTTFLPIKRNKITTKSLNLMQQQVTISPYIKSENKVMLSIYDISELHETKLSLQKEINKVKELNEILETDKNIIDKNIMIKKELIEFNAFYHDITNKKLLEELYITDPLTKLYNRGYFDDVFKGITKHQRKADTDFALVISDIDYFKSINDTYGHQVGDEALKDVASVLKNSLRDNDVIARWGGEEFVIILKNVTIDEAEVITEKLRINIENKKIQKNINVTCSFGLTQYRIGEDTKETFKRVDDALYEAKKSGRNRIVTKL